MTFKECIIFILAINLNPLGLWIDSFVLPKFFDQTSQYIQNDEEHLPTTSCDSQKECVKQDVVR
ncbi:hypothetical protein ABW51_00415 [Haemophilus sp. C1]|uniref:hypothetical protein n=1 Tax=Haemophilus sp. C1 TaxID=1661745 RepID=UPI0006ABBEBF|nr:hypothetical protein [Haemophilus sp. C1]KOQ98392.1 hypothetical protein ABW51_00415 [Haemophilus sp. C1]